MTFVLKHTNCEQPDPAAHRHATIRAATTDADLVTFNEAGKDHATLAALSGFGVYTMGENAIAWRNDKFLLVDKGNKLVMKGGRLGTGRKGDHRRRGPNRYLLWVVLEERASAREVMVATHHSIAKADTGHKWRRALRALGFRNSGAELVRGLRRNPSVAGLLLTGDLNTIGARINFAGPSEVQVPTPATYGRLRYDRLFRSGGVKVSRVGTFTTRSDHKGLRATVELTDSPMAPPPQPPAPTPAPPPPTPPKEEPVSTSANGNRVLFDARTTGPLPRLRKWIVPGANRHLLLRDGSMGFLLIHFALWWHETIGRLDAPGSVWDEWGWAVRPVRGQTSGYSNHASGTAEDLDATRHPIGVSVWKTFSVVQRTRIGVRILWYRGCLTWGVVWRRPDGMHVEISAGLDKCERRARALMKTKRGARILDANPGAKEVIES